MKAAQTTMSYCRTLLSLTFLLFPSAIFLLFPSAGRAQSNNRVTILFDAFGKASKLTPDWGFSALVEYAGKRILFDTGNDAAIFERNVRSLGVDLMRLDFVVISHRHGDHTSGLHYLLRVNPRVKIYTPGDEHFGGTTPGSFLKRGDPSLSPDMRYFGGKPPENVPHGTAWRGANITMVTSLMEVAPGINLVPTVSETRGTLELPELSLSIQTPMGQVLLAGCSHPGIEKIIESATALDKRVALVFGGFHLVTTPDAEIQRIATALRDRWKVDRIAPGHCTGEPGFAAIQKAFGEKYVYAGLGSVIQLS
jgi:7,8-dihydropterin-6-yl-methyl-4-(beta-D-ribofuranosyl)aminobenzene 5'-phosphate synthase